MLKWTILAKDNNTSDYVRILNTDQRQFFFYLTIGKQILGLALQAFQYAGWREVELLDDQYCMYYP